MTGESTGSDARPVSGPLSPGQLIVVTGMTGAGRSTAAKVLEDLGWFVIDNLPPQMLSDAVELLQDQDDPPRMAVVVDVRAGEFFALLQDAIDRLGSRGLMARVLYVEASNEVLIRRQEAARRPHPLQGDTRLLDAIARERELLRDFRGDADYLIDTTNLNVHQLASKVTAMIGDGGADVLRATLVSFGFKYGIPPDADMVLDMRFLPNPHWVPELRPLTGLDPPVRDYVLHQAAAEPFLDKLEGLLETVYSGFVRERKPYVNLALGCTGGKHRSVVLAEAFADRLRERGVETLVAHRDLGRE